MPAQTLEHPLFGTLTFHHVHWIGKVNLAGWSDGKWSDDLKLLLAGDEDGPFAGSAELSSTLIARKDKLGEVITRGLWAELDGTETESGMWWMGDLEAVNESQMSWRSDVEPLRCADDLYRVLRARDLFVMRDTHGDGQLVSGIGFAADFEEEHGLDVLTDGEKVLGSGYALEATKYVRYAKSLRRSRK